MFENHSKVLEGLRTGRFIRLVSIDGVEVYVFRGVERDYIVSPCRFCMCHDFVINVLGRRSKAVCYHVVGFEIARRRGKLRVVHVSSEDLANIVLEIVLQGFSATLRRVLK